MERDAKLVDNVAERQVLTAQDNIEIAEIFQEVDAGKRIRFDKQKFYETITKVVKHMTKEETDALHMKIDIDGKGTLKLVEILSYLEDNYEAQSSLSSKCSFPNPFEIISLKKSKKIVQMLFRGFDDDTESNMEPELASNRRYLKGEYISISKDGSLNFWSDTFERKHKILIDSLIKSPPHGHRKRLHVHDMVYLTELNEMAICTSERELFFYNCQEVKKFHITCSLIVEDIVTSMSYWSNGTKAMFAFGDNNGYLYVFISYNIKTNRLISRESCERIPRKDYKTAYVKNLLKSNSKDFSYTKVKIFNEECSQIQFFPQLESYAICGVYSRKMVLASLPQPPRQTFSKKIFESPVNQEFFTCVEYSPLYKALVTGGSDGFLRVWLPNNTTSCIQECKGNISPITHLKYNSQDRIFVSLSKDKNVRLWAENGLWCKQSFDITDMEPTQISSLCYNVQNNDLILANSDIAKNLGRGTNVFQNLVTTHRKPLCCVLYHAIYKQVVSVCQNGVVMVWDIPTGQEVVQFKVTTENHVGLTAMTFAEKGRKLVTVSEGKVKFWNFNIAKELAVLPVTVQKEVTGIVCMGKRLFVSGRKSNRILDLDIDGIENRFLEHEHLNDICSMDVHDITLVTASSNQNIVVWEAEAGEPLFWLNMSKSIHVQRIKNKAQTGFAKNRKNNETGTGGDTAPPINIRPVFVTLKTRVMDRYRATLLTTADGYISAWSVHSIGGLLGMFRAVNDEGTIITAMSTDVDEHILLTGDSTGRISLWGIKEYGFEVNVKDGPFEVMNGRPVSLSPPPLLRSWQSHHKHVLSIKWDPVCKTIITAGLDGNVEVWTNTAYFVGTFGKDKWNVTQPISKGKLPHIDKKQEETTKNPASQLNVHGDPSLDTEDYVWEIEKLIDVKQKEFIKDIQDIREKANLIESLTDKKSIHDKKRNHTLEAALAQVRDPRAPDTASSVSSKRSLNSLQSVNAAKQGSDHATQQVNLTPISDEVQLTGDQTQLKPHSPQTRLNTGGNNATKTLLRIQPLGNTANQGSGHASQQVRLPPIADKVQLTSDQTQLKPHPPQIRLNIGGNNATKTSLRIRRLVNAAKQGSGQASQPVCLPPISDKFQLTGDQTQLKPHPPQTRLNIGCNNAPKTSLKVQKWWSDQASQQVHSMPISRMCRRYPT